MVGSLPSELLLVPCGWASRRRLLLESESFALIENVEAILDHYRSGHLLKVCVCCWSFRARFRFCDSHLSCGRVPLSLLRLSCPLHSQTPSRLSLWKWRRFQDLFLTELQYYHPGSSKPVCRIIDQFHSHMDLNSYWVRYVDQTFHQKPFSLPLRSSQFLYRW